MRFINILLLTSFINLAIAPISHADDLSVIDVRRNITLSNDETPYKDFYIAGEGVSSLKENNILTVFRRANIRDSSGAHSFGEISIPVGELKIIAVYSRVAVAREEKLLSRDLLPMLEQIGIMSGDSVQLK